MLNKITYKIIALCLYLLSAVLVEAQVKDSTILEGGNTEKIHMLAKVANSKDKILLRWAPSDPVTWLYANKYGYTIEKYKVLQNKKLVAAPVKIVLTKEALKPDPVEQWEDFVEENDYGAVAAQAIYGEEFQLSQNYASDITQVINKSNELEQRFSFALFAADQSLTVAKKSALFYEDSEVNIDDKYLYRVYANVPIEYGEIDTAFYYIGLNDHIPLPSPTGIAAEFSDRMVIISWESRHHTSFYNSYIVERSEDGKKFQSLDDVASINTTKDGRNLRKSHRMDSLNQNDKTYYYRVKGVSAFGEIGPPSEVIEGMGKSALKVDIGISHASVDDAQKVLLDWEVITDRMDLISSYDVERSNNSNGPFEAINDKPIDKDVRSYKDLLPRSTNYYRVVAVSKYGDRRNSFANLVQLQDSIPPAIPILLSGIVDSIGVVTLSWKPNSEDDLLGYRVYRSNFKNSEFGQITNEPVKEAYFSDSITINTLTSSIFYKVAAVDFRFNPSDLSEAVVLKRPDIVPPVSPVFKSIKSVDEGIAIEWINSSSTDVAAHVIYKNKAGENAWNLYQTITSDSIEYMIDIDVVPGTYYNYTMIAVDSAKLESLPAKMITGVKVDTGVREKIKSISTKVDRSNKTISLQWDYKTSGVKEVLIYKRKNESPLSLFKSITGNSDEFVDVDLSINTTYIYRLKAIYKDGAESLFSDEIKVKY